MTALTRYQAAMRMLESSQVISSGLDGALWIRPKMKRKITGIKRRIDWFLRTNANNTLNALWVKDPILTTSIEYPTADDYMNVVVFPMGNETRAQRFVTDDAHAVTVVAPFVKLNASYFSMHGLTVVSAEVEEPTGGTNVWRTSLDRGENRAPVSVYDFEKSYWAPRAKLGLGGTAEAPSKRWFENEHLSKTAMLERLVLFEEHGASNLISMSTQRFAVPLLKRIRAALKTTDSPPIGFERKHPNGDVEPGMSVQLDDKNTLKVSLLDKPKDDRFIASLVLQSAWRSTSLEIHSAPLFHFVTTTLKTEQPKAFAEGMGAVAHEHVSNQTMLLPNDPTIYVTTKRKIARPFPERSLAGDETPPLTIPGY